MAAQAATPEASVPLMEEPQRIPREAIVVSAICLGLAALLRLIAISRREIFGDEFWTLAFVTAERGNFLDNFFHGRLPLYYELFRVWGGIVGTGSELLVRLPSVAFGLLTYIAFAMYAHRYLRRAAFAIALVAFAMNPILVASSIHATPFALLGLIAVLSSSLCIRALDEGGTRNWVLYAAVSVLGALTHPFFWFLLMAQFLFAVARPRQTPRPFLLVSATGIVVGVVLMVLSVIYAERTYPKLVDVSTPSPADLARSLVAVLLGDFPRFGYGDKTFIQALLYLFVIVTLGLSVLYYRRREAEAMALPEGVVWIDDTQDVVGKWNRLSLLSFLMYQWVTFLVPAFGIWMVSTYATDMRMDPEYLVLTLPALVILVAAGVDAAWGRAGSLILGIIFVLIMGAYTLETLADRGYGVEHAAAKLKSEAFDPAGDALVLVNTTGLEAPLERYMKGYPSTQLRGREPIAETRAAVEKAAAGKGRVFVFYHKDYRKFGKAPRSPVREWFDEQMRAQQFNTKVSKWVLSAAERTELRIYSRLKPGEKNTEAAVGAVPVVPPPSADETTSTQ